MIKRQIHYVWVGGNPIPEKVLQIIATNKKILGSTWKIKIWTEKDFDIQGNDFTNYWYQKKQWAFVSDYLRAYFVNKYGGFYLDTDIVLSKSLDDFLKYDYVASRTYITKNTMSIFGSKPSSKVLQSYLQIIAHPQMIKKPPRIISTDIHAFALRKYWTIPDENADYIQDNLAILAEDKLQLNVNKNNVAIHQHHANWRGKKDDPGFSKWYYRKVKYFGKETPKQIKHWINQREKVFKKIKKAID